MNHASVVYVGCASAARPPCKACAGGTPAPRSVLRHSAAKVARTMAPPPAPRPPPRLLSVQNILRTQLMRHIVHREGVPSPHVDMRTGEGGGPDSGYLVLKCKPSGVVLLQRHTAGGYPPCRDSQPTAAARLDFRGG